MTLRHLEEWDWTRLMSPIVLYPMAALSEIVGCFAFWAWARSGASPLWLLPGVLSLIAFAGLLTLVPTSAAYGGIYIAASLVWLWAAEGMRPDRWDILGGAISLAGAGVILWAPRAG